MRNAFVLFLILATADFSNASTTKSFVCENASLIAKVSLIDQGNFYADGAFSVRSKVTGKFVLRGKEAKQRYFTSEKFSWPTFEYLFGCNKNGGGYSEPLMSIWLFTNDADTHSMVYYRIPYLHEDLNCVKVQ